MIPIKLKLVTGLGGSRMDFVAGWLGTLPGWINNQWQVDPVTGQSNGYMRFTKAIDSMQTDLTTLLADHQLQLSQNNQYNWAGACHGFGVKRNNLLPFIEEGTVELLNIVVEPKYLNEIVWNFIVKTFLYQERDLFNLLNYNSPWLIDRRIKIDQPDAVITDQYRCKFLHNMIAGSIESITKETRLNFSEQGISSTIILYSEIIKDSGSEYLENLLGLEVHKPHHRLWKNMLPLSFSPDTMPAWGHTWKRADYNLI